ncbi:MAG: 50S ribosomal protein L15 [Candidatus Eremiobacteraeota bacterium]|nr:50S ribosomal protein L15 [Candidatus Eremiobacteraeota bacterium]
MNLKDIKPPAGSRKRRRRVGRGGKLGKTCGRGENGQNCRSGGGKGPGFEGGQTPWYMRLPKFRGFTNIFRKEFQVICLDDLDIIEGVSIIDPDILYQVGLIKYRKKPVKVLSDGLISKPMTVKLQAFSKNAKKAIEEAGGRVEVI